jgi:hypothetical protein
MGFSRVPEREEIRDLTYRFAQAWDLPDFAILAEVFTSNGVFDASAVGAPRSGSAAATRTAIAASTATRASITLTAPNLAAVR